MPSSIHASSNSFVATMAYQYWWPNSCSTTISGSSTPLGVTRSGPAPAVINVGYSMPPASSAPCGGSTTVSRSYGYGPYHLSKSVSVPLSTWIYRGAEAICPGDISTCNFTVPALPVHESSTSMKCGLAVQEKSITSSE